MHIFSKEHITDGLMKIGKSVGNISLRLIGNIKKADKLNLIKVDPNAIRTYIKGTPVEIHFL